MKKTHPTSVRDYGNMQQDDFVKQINPSMLSFEEIIEALRDILTYNDKGVYMLVDIFKGDVEKINKAPTDSVSTLVKAITQNWMLKK